MKQRNSGFSSYFMFMLVMLMVVLVVSTLNGPRDEYTRDQFIADLEAKKVTEVVVHPNKETPTGYLEVNLTTGMDKNLYVTDVVQAEELVRSYGFDPQVEDVKRDSWFLNTLLPLLIVLAVAVYFALLILFRGMTENELRAMPKGHLLVKAAKKCRLMK